MTYDANLLFADEEKKLTQEPKFDAGLLFDPGKPVAQSNLNIASFGKPDEAVNRKNLTEQMRKELGEDWAPNAIDPVEAKRRLMVAENDHVLNTSPALARQYLDTGFAERTFDDVPKLGKVEAAVNGVIGAGKFVTGAMAYGMRSLNANIVGGALEAPTRVLSDYVTNPLLGDYDPVKPVADFFTKERRAEQAVSESIKRDFAGVGKDSSYLQEQAFGAASSVQQSMATAPFGIAQAFQKSIPMAGNAVSQLFASAAAIDMKALIPMMLSAGGQTFAKGTDQGLDSGTAAAAGIANAGFEGVFERLGLGQFVREVKVGAPLWQMMRNTLITENVTEQLTTVFQDFTDWAVMPEHANDTFGDYLAERPSAALDTFVQTTMATMVQTGAMRVASRSQIKAAQAQQAVAAGQALTYLNQSIGESATAARDRGTLQQFLQSAAVDEDGNPQTVRINALAFENTLMQAGIDPQQVLAKLPTAQEQWEVAKAAGVDLEIPLAELAGQTFGTDVGNALLPHIAVGEEGMSLVEAQDFAQTQAEEFRKQAEIVMAENDRDGAFVQSAKEVEKIITDQILATGRYTADIAKTNALPLRDFFVTQAAALGITPMALYQQFQQKTVAEGQGALQQGGVQTVAMGDRSIPVRLGKQDERSGFSLVPVDTVAFDAGFKAADSEYKADMYVGPQGQGGIAGRYERFGEFQKNADFIEASTVSVDDQGRVTFGNGRHRFAYMRDQGAPQIPVAMDAESLANAQAFGYTAVPPAPAFAAGTTDPSILAQKAYGFEQTETDSFKSWSNDAPLVTGADADTYEFKTGEKVALESFHGTRRPDRVGTAFKKSRATSGPMAFFTSSQELASGYATGKQDTSLANEDQQYANWFKFLPEGQRTPINIVRAWYHLDGETKAKIREMAPKISADPEGMSDSIVVRDDNTSGNGSYDYNLAVSAQSDYQRKGNPLEALVEDWLNSGVLYNDEAKFMEVLRVAGFPVKSVTFDDPNATYPFVYKTYIKMQKPLVTSQIPQGVIDALDAAAKRDRSKAQNAGADAWDKNTKTLRDWVAAFHEADNKYVWTSIPDKVTNVFKDFGYDGIIDWSGKGGGTSYPVYIPFNENQVKSAIGNKGTFGDTSNILKQENRAGFSPDSLTIILGKGADLSSFLHESAHFYLKVMGDLAARKDAPPRIREQMEATLKWFGIQGSPEVSALDHWNSMTLEEQRPYHEKWAESFEAYLFSGRAPSIELQTAFSRFKAWMLRVYTSYKEFLAGPNGQNADLNPEIAAVFDRLLATDAQIKLAEQARSMMPVFGSEADSGMTVEEWAAYQEIAREPTEEAKAELGAKGVKDLTWLRNLTKRMTRKYNLEAQDLREELAMEARREVMTQPIYLAWQFLTGKPLIEDESIKEYRAAVVKHNKQRDAELTDQRKNAEDQLWAESVEGQKKYRKLSTMQKARVSFISAMDDEITEQAEKLMAPWDQANPAPVDPRPAPTVKSGGVDAAVDTLFTAIAKLGGINTDAMREQWGVDKREKSPQPAFGKRVWHTKGRTLDEMRLALQEYGYLKSQDAEDWNPRELEERFHAELAGDPQYSLNADYDALRGDGQQTAVDPEGQGKFSLEGLRSIGLPEELINHLKALRMTGKDGFDPDQIAQQFGFSSGDELARKIAAAPTPKEAVESLVDQRMIENHGELASPKAISDAVDAAIHNEARARLVATELRYLTRSKRGQGDKGPSVRVLMAAAKEFADTLLGRKKLKDINSSVFVSAATKAAQNARQAIIDGDQDVAAAELRNQLLNTTAAKHAIDARDEVQKGVKYLRRFATTKGIKSIDIEYLEQIEQLLERFDLKQRSTKELQRRMGLAAWIAEQEAQGLDPVVDQNLIDDARLQHFTDMTLDEFRGLIDTVKSIEHLGRLKKKLLTLKDKRELAEVVADLEESIRDNANREVKDKNPVTKLDKTKRFFINLGAHHRKFASLIREMDGGKDGGKMWEAFVRGMNESGDKEATLRADMSKRLVEIFKGIKHLNLGAKIYLPEIGTSLRREEVLAIALNSGNAGNVQRLLDGGINNEVRKLSTAQLSAILNRISNEEWDVVEGVWKLIEGNRPAIAALEKSLTGVEPKWIEPNPFPLASGRVIAGGYYPAKYNAMFSTRSAELEAITDLRQQTKGAMGNSSTRKSYTEQRAKEVKGRPLKLDLGVIAQHINEVTHRLAWQEWLIDSRRILKANPVEEAIKDHYGVAVLNEMKDHLQAIAEGDQGAQDAWGVGAHHLRTGATIVGMGWNLMTALTQPIGITQSIERVGAKWIGKGMKTYLSNPFAAARAVQESSDMMANRAMTMQREINEILNTVRSEKMSKLEGSYFWMIQKFQQMVDTPTWLGAYEKAAADPGNITITNGVVDDSRAVALADQAVLDSQGGGQIKDLSGIQRGNEYKKLFTNFYSFFNVLHQRMAETHRGTNYTDPLSVGKAATSYLMLFVLPTIWMMALKEAMRGDDDDQDEEEWLKKYAKEQLSYLLGTTILGRELVSAIASFRGYQGPAGLRFFTEIGKFAKQSAKAIEEGEIDMPWFKSAMSTAGVLLHLPTGQISRMIEGANLYLEGAAGPQAAIVGPPIKD